MARQLLQASPSATLGVCAHLRGEAASIGRAREHVNGSSGAALAVVAEGLARLSAAGPSCELHNKAQLAPTQSRRDRPNYSRVAANHDPLAYLEGRFSAEASCRDDLIASTQLIAVLDH